MIYFFTFISSIVLCYVGEKLEKSKKKKYGPFPYLLYGFAVLLLIILAGCRDYSIGTDIGIYGNLLFNGATINSNFAIYLKNYGSRAEPLYLLLNFIISRLTDSAHWLYAVVGAIIYIGFFVGLYRFRDRVSLTYGWTVFILLFYGISYNLMRQMLAMSMLFMGSIHVLNKKYIRFLPYVILAALFHQTSIVFSVAIIGIRILIPKKNKGLYKFAVFMGAVFLIFGYSYVIQWLIGHGILAEKYSQYIYQYNFNIAINPLIQRAFPILMFLIFSKKKYKDEDEIRTFLQSMMYLDLILIVMGSLGAAPLQRVAAYCSIYNLYAYPFFIRRINPEYNRRVVGTFIVIALIGIWIYQYVYRGNAEIFPYTSEVLGIK